MPGYRPPNTGSLENTLARELADIKRRLTILERPTGTQKMQTTQRVIEAQADATKALAEVATERQRNDTQWTSIDAANAAIATERQRNDTQWTSIDSLRNRVDSLSGTVGGMPSSSTVEKIRQQVTYLLEWAKQVTILLNSGGGNYPNPPEFDMT